VCAERYGQLTLTAKRNIHYMVTDNFIPDFSQDDLKDDKEVQELRLEREKYEKILKESLAILKSKLRLEYVQSIFEVEDEENNAISENDSDDSEEVLFDEIYDTENNNLNKFSIFSNLNSSIVDTFRSIDGRFHLDVFVVEYESEYKNARVHYIGFDKYLLGHIVTKKKFPRTYIQPESIKDKLLNLFLKQDLNFKNSKQFSNSFQVLTDEKQEVTHIMQNLDLDKLSQFHEMEIEFVGNSCLFRSSRKPISINDTDEFIDLTNIICSLFG